MSGNLNPSHRELWERIERAEDIACDGGWSYGDEEGCSFCRSVVETLRGGQLFCDECGHINTIGHSCADWKEYDAGTMNNDEVGRRWRERDAARFSETTTSNAQPVSVAAASPSPETSER